MRSGGCCVRTAGSCSASTCAPTQTACSRWQERLAGPWAAFADGCRCNQETLGLIERTLRIERLEREEWRGMPGLVRPLIVGEARVHDADMPENGYDAIVVGARCAGSPTAMLLARKGYRVLVVDRATFPSDTISTHLIHPPGVAALKEWGLLDRLVATGCPGIDTYSFDFGRVHDRGRPRNRRGAAGLLPATHRARQAAGGRRVGGGRRGPGGVHGRGSRGRGRARDRHSGAPEGRTDRHRTSSGGRGRRRPPLARGAPRRG